jgi:hypothetical protein
MIVSRHHGGKGQTCPALKHISHAIEDENFYVVFVEIAWNEQLSYLLTLANLNWFPIFSRCPK